MAVITILALLVILKHCSGHAIEGCTPGEHKDVPRYEMNYRFKCVDVPANYYVAWLITRQDPSNGNQLTNTDVCSMTDDKCHSYSEGSGAIRVNNITSILFFYPSVINDIIGITCRVFDKELTRTLSYINDYTCDITLLDTPKMECVLQATHHGSRRTVLCTITNILDLTQDYQCQFTEELQDGSPGRLLVGTRDGTYELHVNQKPPGPSDGDCSFSFDPALGIDVVVVNLGPYNVQARAEFLEAHVAPSE